MNAQTAESTSAPSNLGHPPTILAPDDPAQQQFERQAQVKLNQDREIALKRDTNKLLAMATDLKHSVDRTNADILSVDVIKKAQEIEKLAKSIREKMAAN